MNAVLTRRAVRQRQRLLLEWRRQGTSLREIARRLNLAPKTVKQSLAELELAAQDELPEPNDPPPGFDPANIRRCRTCGALVYLWPCLACSLTEPAPEPLKTGVTCHAHS
jgi:hypothetical protein